MSLFSEANAGLEHPAFDSEIRVGEFTFLVARSLGLTKRLENAFGPLRTLLDRLQTFRLTVDQLVRLYVLVCEEIGGKELRPTRAEIEAHLFEVGTVDASEPMAMVVSALFAGNRKYSAFVEGQAKPREAAPSPMTAT